MKILWLQGIRSGFVWGLLSILGAAVLSYLTAQSCESIITLQRETAPRVNIEGLNYRPVKSIKVGLVLSGGGARGLAHIGVLKALEEHRIPVDLIVGTSIGSVIGGFYAAGYSADQIIQIVHNIDWENLFTDETYRTNLFVSQKNIPRRHVVQLRFDGFIPYIPTSISQGQKVLQILYSRLLKANFQAANNFDNLKIPFRAVATDLLSGRRVVLNSGDLAEAMNASMAVPLLFAPVEWADMLLVDGGITDNLPVDVARDLGAEFIIAVDATSPLRERHEIRAPWEIADQVTTIMMSGPTEERRQEADVLIVPDLGNQKSGDFSNIDSIIQKGYQAAMDKLDAIRRNLRQRRKNLWGENRYLGLAARVHFEGIPDSIHRTLQKRFRTREGDHIYRLDVLSDLRLLDQTGLFQDVRVCVKGTPGERMFVFQGTLFPRVQQVQLMDGQEIPDSLRQRVIQTALQRPFNIQRFLEAVEDIRNTLIEEGYTLFSIEGIQYLPERKELVVRFNPGTISRIEIIGNRRTRRSIILREFPLKAGDVFKGDAAVQGIQNIYSTGLFDRVSVNVEKDDGGNVLIIKVKEKHYLLMRLGAHASLERKSDAFLEFLEDNLFGQSIKMSLMGIIGEYRREAELSLYTIRIFNTLLTSRLRLYYRERVDQYFRDFELQGTYKIIRRGINFSIGQQIQRLGLISAELRMEGVSTLSAIPEFRHSRTLHLRSLVIRSVVDKRDRLPFPNSGIYNRWFWESGSSRLLLSSTSYTRIFLGLEGYYPISKHFNYHPFVFAGSGDVTVPFTEYFGFGGQFLFPGLYEREKLGRQFLLTGIELRYRFPFRLPETFLFFKYAVGGSWERPDDRIRRSDFLHSISSTLAVNTLLGPIQFTVSRLVNHRTMVYFTIGFDF
ncbi:MAG: BamA/TamA family outer membrane protein [Calditrichaeota bacterium]|nr:BamA/TamA family outer membrane protein [Calditrichota bacterium]